MVKEYRQRIFSPPAGSLDLLLVRHGESEAAREGVPFALFDGQGDPALHPNGKQQAEQVANRLESNQFDALYVTSLRRTQQTAAPLARLLDMTPIIEPDLREVFLGDWDAGLYRIKAAKGDPTFRKAFETHEWGEIPGAETTAELHARVAAALERMRTAHAGQRVVAFVHGGVIGAVMSLATGARPFAFNGAANGSISRVVLSERRMIVRGYNDCTHLTD